jgi:hypothetical protein
LVDRPLSGIILIVEFTEAQLDRAHFPVEAGDRPI